MDDDVAAAMAKPLTPTEPVPPSAFRFATVQGPHVQWFLRRNCSIRPTQLGWLYASICFVSLGVGAAFWSFGAPLVIPFAGLEMAALGLAFILYAQHAADGERILLEDDRLIVELENAGKLERAEFNREWVRVEPHADDHSLIALSAHGKTIQVGRFVRPEMRSALAKEIRMALRQDREAAVPAQPGN